MKYCNRKRISEEASFFKESVLTQGNEFAQMSMRQIQQLCDSDLNNHKTSYQYYMDFAKVTSQRSRSSCYAF